MSAPRLVLCGLEPGPAVALAAGALLTAFADGRAVRPVLLGADLPLWRLCYGSGARTPRILDPRLLDDTVAGELYDLWADDTDLTAVVAVEPALDRWEDVKGSRALDVALALDAPLVLIVDARERGATVGAWVCGLKMLARGVELAGVIVVGGDEPGRAAGLRALIEDTAKLPVLGWVPPQLSEQFARQYGSGAAGALRQIGPQPVKGGEAALCREAATYLDRAGIEAAAARRGFLPARPRRLLAPLPAAAGLKLAVGWGPPLEPFALEGIDQFKALGLELEPVHLARDTQLPAGAAGLLLVGLLDEEELGTFAANEALKAAVAEAIAAGLPTLALGGGALLLLRRLADSRGRSHELAGVLPAEAELLEWYERPRYVQASAARENPYAEGETTLYELFDLEFLTLQQESFAWRLDGAGEEGLVEGFVHERCLATTLVPSLPATPALAAGFVAAMRRAAPHA
jgi:cobyrinic acid a,c-diamide synthase